MPIYSKPSDRRIIYLSITDHINKYPYKLVDIPSETEELSSYELDMNTGGPIRQIFPGEVSSGMYTINWMIQAYHDHTPFTFDKPSDVCHVAWKLDEYVHLLKIKQTQVPLTKEEIEYLDKSVIFLSYIKKKVKVVLSRRNKYEILREQNGDKLFENFLEASKGG